MCELTLNCYAKLQQTNVKVLFFFFEVFFFLEKIKLDISCELSALIKFYFFLKNKKLNTLTLLELCFIFPLLGKGLFSVRC